MEIYNTDTIEAYLELIDDQKRMVKQLIAEVNALKKEVDYLQEELMNARGDSDFYHMPTSER